jgi:hypothetical protein
LSDSLSLEPFICDAIRAYMKPTLPEGTRLRASFGQMHYSAPEAAQGNGVQRKNGSKRGARRKRRAAEHISGNP